MKKFFLLFLICTSLNGMESDALNRLFKCARGYNGDGIEAILKKYPDLINARERVHKKEHHTLLTKVLSQFRNHYQSAAPIILMLLEKGANPNLGNGHNDETPLWIVISTFITPNQHLKWWADLIIFILLEKGADIGVQDCWGQNPLHKIASIERIASIPDFNTQIENLMNKLIRWHKENNKIAIFKEALTTKSNVPGLGDHVTKKTPLEFLDSSKESLKALFDPTKLLE